MGLPSMFDIKRPVQSHMKARSLNFRILEEEGMYYQ